jgi:hypothetical protein
MEAEIGFVAHTLDICTIVAASDDMYVIASTNQSLRPVPADTGLRALAWFTRVRRKEKLHDLPDRPQ